MSSRPYVGTSPKNKISVWMVNASSLKKNIDEFTRERLDRWRTNSSTVSDATTIDQNIRESLNVPARLDEFRGMQDGWLEGRGKAPSDEGLNWLSKEFTRRYPEDLPLPYLYPTEAGGVQAEWTIGEQEISLEVNLSNHKGEWDRADLSSNTSDNDEMREVDLDTDDDWIWFLDRLQALFNEIP